MTVCDPLQLTLQTPITDETEHTLGVALQGQLETLRERGFIPIVCHVGPHSTFVKLKGRVLIDPGGARDRVPKCDAKMRRLKDTYRAVLAGLSYKLPGSRTYDLLGYCVSRMNIRRTSTLQGVLSPRFF